MQTESDRKKPMGSKVSGSLTPDTASAMLSKVAFTYWHQGFADAPRVVRMCVAQLRRQNPDWQINALDRDSVEELVKTIPISPGKLARLSLPHRSDLIRTHLLIEHGGVWIDPTVYVTQPFDTWLISNMQAGLFFFSKPGPDRLISNWFISSMPNHPILVKLYGSLCEYWQSNNFRNHGRGPNRWEGWLLRGINRNLDWPRVWFSWPLRKLIRVYPYMVYHYLLFDLISRNKDLWAIYSDMPRFLADGPCSLQRNGLHERFDHDAQRVLLDRNIPLHKLKWRIDGSESYQGSILEHLTQESVR